jgi:hypothetical protein
MTMRSSCALLLPLLVACSRHRASPGDAQRSDTMHAVSPASVLEARVDTSKGYCWRVAGPVYISEDSIGPLDLGTTVASLRATCRAAYETVVYGEESTNPAVAFPFEGLTATAVQHQDSLLPRQVADAWTVTGPNGLLFGRLRLSAPWAEFRDAFGPGIVSSAGRVTVMFCAHPRLLFVVDASTDSVALDQQPGSWNHNLSRIPRLANIKEVDIFPRPMADWSC